MNCERSSNRSVWQRKLRLAGFGILLGAFVACADEGAERVIRGSTMGTTYAIKFGRDLHGVESQRIAAEVEALLVAINRSMSTYDPGSELSQFNAADDGQWIALSAELAAVLAIARVVHEQSAGAFDITLGPLINLWGFGPTSAPITLPTPAAVSARLASTGMDQIDMRVEPPAWRKSDPDVYVDLSAIAKGYAVDRVADLLRRKGIDDFMVEIGGEIRVSGYRLDGERWRIGLDKPTVGRVEIARVIEVTDIAMASSGNYRNFRVIDGKQYDHTIDPRDGYPVRHDLAAVTVLHESAAWADAWATALLVLGPVRGVEVAEQHRLRALFTMPAGAPGAQVETQEFRFIVGDSDQ